MTEPWFSISGEEILQALHDVAKGMDPDLAYARIKAESEPGGVSSDQRSGNLDA